MSRPTRPVRSNNDSDRKRSLLIFTEGEKTEVLYLLHLYRSNRERVAITIDSRHGTPFTLVSHAVNAKRQQTTDERRGRGSAYDDYWCMFDVDNHSKMPEALDLAQGNGINVAISNPCIELWFVLHSQAQTAFIHRHAIQALSRRLYKFDKNTPPESLTFFEEKYAIARQRSHALAVMHQNNFNAPSENPSTSIPALIDRIVS